MIHTNFFFLHMALHRSKEEISHLELITDFNLDNSSSTFRRLGNVLRERVTFGLQQRIVARANVGSPVGDLGSGKWFPYCSLLFEKMKICKQQIEL